MRRAALALGLMMLGMALAEPSKVAEGPKKNGAGLLFITPDGSVLLLLRAGKHNTGKWGLPGGNVEDSDADLLTTAKREAAEELGGDASLPPYEIVGNGFLTKRGRFGAKHFTVFVARVTNEARDNFRAPNLNALEHTDYKWFTVAQIDKLADEGKLHPVVKKLMTHQRAGVLRAAGVKTDDNQP